MAGPVFVQGAAGSQAGAGGSAICNVAMPGNVTAGNMLVVVVGAYWSLGLTVYSLTDSLGNTYIQLNNSGSVGGPVFQAATSFYCISAASGPCTITFSTSAPNVFNNEIAAAEYSGTTIAIAGNSFALMPASPGNYTINVPDSHTVVWTTQYADANSTGIVFAITITAAGSDLLLEAEVNNPFGGGITFPVTTAPLVKAFTLRASTTSISTGWDRLYETSLGGSPITLSCPVSNIAVVGSPYAGSMVESGGTGPFTYALISGALPSGITLNASTGAITGTSTAATGTYPFGVQVTDSLGATATASCSLILQSTLALACPVSNTAAPGVPYSGTLVASGGLAPYAFVIIAGLLPPGMTLNPTTGVISGTSSALGGWAYTARVTDSFGTTAFATCQISLTASGCGQCAAIISDPVNDSSFELLKVIPMVKINTRIMVRGANK